MLLLLADGQVANPQVVNTAGGMVIGTVLTIIVNGGLALMRDRREAEARIRAKEVEDEKEAKLDTKEDMREVLDRTVEQLKEVRTELRECHKEHAETRERCNAVEKGFSRAVAWIEALQYQLDAAGVKFPRFSPHPTGDTAAHPRLPPKSPDED